jgi:hypothetical protein
MLYKKKKKLKELVYLMCTHSYFTVDSHRKITSLPLVGKLTKLEFRGRKVFFIEPISHYRKREG